MVAVFIATAGGAWSRQAPPPSPTPIPLDTEQTIGGMGFACTGIGQEKDDPRWTAYPVRLEFSNPAGDLLANAAVTLSTASGQTIATVKCEGPWILLRPAPGAYKADAWMPGTGLHHHTATFSAPAGGHEVVDIRFPEN
jgi:hypothetical protein